MIMMEEARARRRLLPIPGPADKVNDARAATRKEGAGAFKFGSTSPSEPIPSESAKGAAASDHASDWKDGRLGST